MLYQQTYDSPVGKLLIAGNEAGLAGLWREEYCHYLPELSGEEIVNETAPILELTKDWLDRYFAGEIVSAAEIPLAQKGSAFRHEVWEIVRDIPYGQLITYGEIARIIAGRRGIRKMAAQAIGGAVGHNPVSIIVPCHRVVGVGGNLTGYGGSMWVKKWLLEHEGIDLTGFY